MLSDFDLAKQTNEPGGLPATVHQEENGVRSFYLRCSVPTSFVA